MKKRKVIKWLVLLKAALLLALACWIAWEVYDPKRHILGYSVYGIDVSKWQPSINWGKAKRDGLTFIFIKATEGASHVDPRFHERWKMALKTDWVRGAYHYYQPTDSPQSQAHLFCETVSLEKGDLFPVVDIEEFPGKKLEEFQRNLVACLKEIESCFGVKPILYASRNYYIAFLKDSIFESYPLWVANYQEYPTEVGDTLGRSWDFWQYSNTGKVKGITGNVDLNVFNGSFTELSNFCLN